MAITKSKNTVADMFCATNDVLSQEINIKGQAMFMDSLENILHLFSFSLLSGDPLRNVISYQP